MSTPPSLLSQAATMPEKFRGPSVAKVSLPGILPCRRRTARRASWPGRSDGARTMNGPLATMRDRNEIRDRIVGQRLEGIGIGDERGRGREQEGVAVGRRARRRLRADRVAGARPVLDDDLLAERARQPVAEQPADDVGRAAGGLRDDELDRLRGPALRVGAGGREQQRQKRERAADEKRHGLPLRGPRSGPALRHHGG